MPRNINDFDRVNPINSGIVEEHIGAIHQVCQKQNVFLFIRPSEPATMRLIKRGFATKSMDVHDKSSDWGLMAGLVPCDKALSKTLEGRPNPKIKDEVMVNPKWCILHLNRMISPF